MDRVKNGRAVPGVIQLEFRFDSAPPRSFAGTLRRVQLAGFVLRYRFVRARRRTIAILVDRGEVEARAPRHAPIAEVEAFLRDKERWIARRMAESTREPPPFRWVQGETLSVLGRAARLTPSPGTVTVRLADDQLLLPAAAGGSWRELAIAWLRSSALELFRERIRHYAAALGVREPSLGLSNARTQWGGCWKTRGASGRVLLNWRLYQLPPHLADYVVAHELAHLRELNHSSRFWAIVERLFPDYQSARRELHRLGRALPTL